MTTVTVKSGEEAAKVVRQVMDSLQDDLRDTEAIGHAYASALFQEAQSRARTKPTPQSRMAADNMGVQGTEISVLSGGPPAEVSGGSEWGSNIYRQFGPRNEGGYWLFPSAESPEVKAAGDRYLALLTEKAVRARGL